MGIRQNYNSLSKSTKRLLNVGLILAILVALPLFVWSVVNMTFDLRERAQVGTTIDLNDEPFLGYEDSPVTIVMYSDFQCVFCKSFVDNTLSTIMSTYANQVKFIHKDFPIQLHPLAESAAKAGYCAYKQNKFWEMHGLIFQNQESLSDDSFTDFATAMNLDQNEFESCLVSQEATDEVNSDKNEGLNMGVNGTPTFYINGQKLVGALAFENFKALIDQALVDDLYFSGTGSITFRTIDQNPNVVIKPTDLVHREEYSVEVEYMIQNNLKYSHATPSSVLVTLYVNNDKKNQVEVPYNLITSHTDGVKDILTTNFLSLNSSNSIRLTIDENSQFSESNEENNSYEIIFSKSTSSPKSTATATATSKATSTSTPKPTPTPAAIGGFVEGEPNSCGGTCGSNYNCKSNLYCYQGTCRNPVCSTDSDCNCDSSQSTNTPTATATTKASSNTSSATKATSKTTAKPTSISQPKGGVMTAAPITSIPPTGGFTPNLTRDEEKTDVENKWLNDFANYTIYIGAGIILVVIISLIAKSVKKKNDNIPHIVPPQNI